MSINFNRSKGKLFNDRRVFKIQIILDTDLYADEGIAFHPEYRKGFRNPCKHLRQFQVRRYRTWKYNRKRQYK